jgi:hypothetical protein
MGRVTKYFDDLADTLAIPDVVTADDNGVACIRYACAPVHVPSFHGHASGLHPAVSHPDRAAPIRVHPDRRFVFFLIEEP